MTKLPFFAVLVVSAIALVGFRNAEMGVVVREVVGNGKLKPGQLLIEPQAIRTDEAGRLQLDFGHSTFRVGANTVVQINGSNHAVEQQGSLLFDKLSGDKPVTAWLGNQKVMVKQGTGFMHTLQDDGGQSRVVIGGMAAKTKVLIHGTTATIQPGELLVAATDGSIVRASFDLPRQVRTSVLINDFTTPLQSKRELDRQVARFALFEKRGFVRVLREGNASTMTVGEVQGQTRRTVSQLGIEQLPNQIAIAENPTRPLPPPGGSVGGAVGGPGARDDDDSRPPVTRRPITRPGDGYPPVQPPGVNKGHK